MKRPILAATMALLIGVGGVQAQNIREKGQPKEYPPASFAGKQYIDSAGCVYIRAGFDGAVTWVPRVSRKRTVLCGQKPTFAAPAAPAPEPRVVAAAPVVVKPRVEAAPRVVAKPRVEAAPRVVAKPRVVAAPRIVAKPPRVAATPPKRITATPPKRITVAAAPPRRVVTAPAPAPVRILVKPAPTVTAPAPTRTVPRATVVAPTRRVQTACPGASALSQQYLKSTSGYAVRCGPQASAPSGRTQGATGISYDGAEAPRVIRVAPAPKITPPPGYRAAWEDDRLNPNRGVQTAEGYAQSSLIWTNTTPRRLIDQRTGNDVTRLFPWLKFPSTTRRSMEQQVAYRQNIGVRPPVRVAHTHSTIRQSTKAVAPVRAVAPPRPSAVPAGHRYVQVGMFGVASNAQNSAARLQRMGLPVRIGTYQKAGKSYKIVLAGPFGSASALQSGLAAARRAGFSDAYTRK